MMQIVDDFLEMVDDVLIFLDDVIDSIADFFTGELVMAKVVLIIIIFFFISLLCLSWNHETELDKFNKTQKIVAAECEKLLTADRSVVKLVESVRDSWGNELQYWRMYGTEKQGTMAVVTSSGPDGKFNTNDDITKLMIGPPLSKSEVDKWMDEVIERARERMNKGIIE